MSGYASFSKADSANSAHQGSQFGQRVWQGQRGPLKDMYAQAGQLFGLNNQQLQQMLPGVIQGMNNIFGSAAGGVNNALAGGAYQGINGAEIARGMQGGLQNPQALSGTNDILSKLGPVGNNQSDILSNFKLADTSNPFGSGPTDTQSMYASIMGGNGNDYADAMKKQVMDDASRTLQSNYNTLDQRASQAGMPGSSRQGIAQAQISQDVNRNAQNNLTDIGYNTFDKDLQQKLRIAEQADANRLGAYQAGLTYNKGIADAYNQGVYGNQQYNMGYGGLGNAANQNAMNYNLGTNQNITQGNLGLQGLLSGLLGGQQGAMNTGLGAAQGVQGMAGAGMNASMMPWEALGQYANALGGPTILGSGNSWGQSQGNSSSLGMSGGGSGSGGGGGVICTELRRQGILSEELYSADCEWFDEFASKRENFDVVIGYRTWAPYVVKAMRKSPTITKLVSKLALPWAHAMAHQIGAREKDSIVGRWVMKIGMPICAYLGRNSYAGDHHDVWEVYNA